MRATFNSPTAEHKQVVTLYEVHSSQQFFQVTSDANRLQIICSDC